MSVMTDDELAAMMAEIEGTPATTKTEAKAEVKPETPKSDPAPSAAAETGKSATPDAPVEQPALETVRPEPDPIPETEVKADPGISEAEMAELLSDVAAQNGEPAPEPTPTVAETAAVEAMKVDVVPPKPAPRPAADGTLLNPFIDTERVKKDISINSADLDTAMIEHAGLELHYAIQTANARRQYERLKAANEILEAKIDAHVRESWVGEKKPTEAAIKAAVLADKRYSAAQSKMIDAQHIWKLCEATENAFRSRKDLLLECARDRRKEKEGQLRVLENQEMRNNVLTMLKEASKVA